MSFKLDIEMEDNTITIHQNLPGFTTSSKHRHRIRCNESKDDWFGSTLDWAGSPMLPTGTLSRELLDQALALLEQPTRRR